MIEDLEESQMVSTLLKNVAGHLPCPVWGSVWVCPAKELPPSPAAALVSGDWKAAPGPREHFPVLCTSQCLTSWAWPTCDSERLFFQWTVLKGECHYGCTRTRVLQDQLTHVHHAEVMRVHVLLYSHLDDYLKTFSCHCLQCPANHSHSTHLLVA